MHKILKHPNFWPFGDARYCFERVAVLITFIKKEFAMHKLIVFYSLFFVVIASLSHAGGDEEDQLLNTNACVNCDLSNAWLERGQAT